MIDFIPGDPLNAEIEAATQGLADVTQQVEMAESVIDDTDAAIIVPIIEEIKEAEALCNEVSGVCIGEVEVAVSDAEDLIGRIKQKLKDELDSLLGDVYADMGQLGFDVPTDAELAYMEGTGRSVLPPNYGPGQVTLPGGTVVDPYPTNQIPPIAGECPEGYYLDSSDNLCKTGLPDSGTSVGGSGGEIDPIEPPQCPAGYHWEPDTTSDEPSGGIDNPMPMRNGRPLSVVPCEPAINEGYSEEYSQPFPGNEPDSLYQFPSLSPPTSSAQGLFVTEEIDGCHFRPPMTGSVTLHYAPGLHLIYDTNEGQLYAADNVPSGFVLWSSVTQTPGSGPGQPGGNGGGQCVPDTPIGKCRPEDVLCGEKVNPWEKFPHDEKKEDVCKQIEEAIDKAKDQTLSLGAFLHAVNAVGSTSTIGDAIINAITGGHEPIIGNLTRRFGEWLDTNVKEAANSTACGSPAFLNVAVRRAILRFVDKWTDTIPQQALESTEQISNTICQSKLPTGANADVAYLADEITKEIWECWHKAEGNHLAEAKKLMLAKRQRISAREADLLYRRKKIDFEEMRKRMRRDGVIDDDDMFDIRELNEYQTTATSLIAQMKRDVFDPEAVEKLKLDEDFDKKFPGEAEKLADAIGMRKEQLRNEWRAHWHNPSYSMAREFLHRFNDPDLPENIRFDETAMRELLKYDDWTPGHVDRMIANAYHPVTRTDVVKAFMIHGMSDDEFVKRFKKTGYTESDTRFYLEYYKKRRLISDRKGSGFPTLRTAVNAYARCELTENQFNDIARKIAIDDDQRDAAIEAARTARDVWERKQTIRTVKRPFILGIYDEQTARDMLNRVDTDAGCVNSLIEQWQRERLRRDKFLSASQLCQMYERGIITERDMVIALVRSGWEEADAMLITANCGAMVSEKLAKRARIEAEKAARQLKQQLKDQEKARRLAECGPPPCPKNRTQNGNLVGAGQ